MVSILYGNNSITENAGKPIDELFFKTAESYSESVAIRGEKSLTYHEMSTAVMNLVQRLNRFGIKKNHTVIIQIPRSAEFIIAAFAVLSLKAIFVPISPEEPEEYFTHICRNTGARIKILCKEHAENSLSAFSIENITEPSISQGLGMSAAYIMHTSGTTGHPKGVIIPMEALINCLDWHKDFLKFSRHDRMTHLSRPSFDFSIPEMFLPLIHGGSIILPRQSLHQHLLSVLEALAYHQASVAQFVPTLLHRVLRALTATPHLVESLQSIKHVVCNGEVLSDNLRRHFYSIFPNANLHHCYGPTETCVAVTHYLCPKDQDVQDISLGPPAPNVLLEIRDKHDKPVDQGTTGELFIGGIQNARGYAGNRDETYKKFHFLDTPYGVVRFYRSGDLVQLTSNQQLLFLGRRDSQVKFHGVRIELQEIATISEETKLCTHACALICMAELTGLKEDKLVCFVTPNNANEQAISDHLRKNLPAEKRPEEIVALEQFPVTDNGKLDTQELMLLFGEIMAMQAETKSETIEQQKQQNNTEKASSFFIPILEDIIGPDINEAMNGDELAITSIQFLELQIALAHHGLEFSTEIEVILQAPVVSWIDMTRPIKMQHEDQHSSALPPSNASAYTAEMTRKTCGDLEQFFYGLEQQTPTLIMLHTSLMNIGPVEPDHLIEKLLQLIEQSSDCITWVLPAFTFHFTQHKCYDVKEAGSDTGSLPLKVLELSGSVRTKHPLYSFVIKGPRAAYFACEDWWSFHPFGDQSFLAALPKHTSLIAGISTHDMVYPHRCEYLARVPYQNTRLFSGRMNFDDKWRNGITQIYTRDVPGSDESYLLAQNVPKTLEILNGLLHQQTIGNSYGFYGNMGEIETCLIQALKQDPFCLLIQERIASIKHDFWDENAQWEQAII